MLRQRRRLPMPNSPCGDSGIILCPSCGKLAYWHSHFGCYICEACGARTSEAQARFNAECKEPVDIKKAHEALDRWIHRKAVLPVPASANDDDIILSRALDELEALRSTLAATEKRRDELSTQVTHMASTMKAAAAEIEAHWDAHCDKEGYGPTNLIERLKGENLKLGYACYPGHCVSLDKAERERDEEKAGAAQMRGALEVAIRGVAEIRRLHSLGVVWDSHFECDDDYMERSESEQESFVEGFKRGLQWAVESVGSADESLAALSTTSGRDFLTRYNEAEGLLQDITKAPQEMQEMMRREGFAINNLDDRWQKLAFTLYTRIVSMATGADAFLKGGER
jgi:hypothetical protein